MDVKKSDASKKLIADGMPNQPVPIDESAKPEAEFVPLQSIGTTDTQNPKGVLADKNKPIEDAAEKPFLIYVEGEREERPILDVRKPAFTPSIKEREKKTSQKAHIELPE